MMSLLWKAWGWVSGFSLQTYLIAAAVAGFALWTYLAYDAGYDKADAIWRAKALEAKVAKLELQIKIAEEAERREDAYLKELVAENEQTQKEIERYVDELSKRPDKCLLGTDADKLNSL